MSHRASFTAASGVRLAGAAAGDELRPVAATRFIYNSGCSKQFVTVVRGTSPNDKLLRVMS
jgi:hypothetical protein